MSNQAAQACNDVTAIGKDIVDTFNAIANNPVSHPLTIEAAFVQVLKMMQTQGDLQGLKQAWLAYANRVKLCPNELEAGLLAVTVQSQYLIELHRNSALQKNFIKTQAKNQIKESNHEQ